MATREIKFRGKEKHGKKWLYGDLAHRDGDIYIFPKGSHDSYDRYRVDPDTVGQLTPFKDSYENQIYEGDLVKDHITGIIFEVVFTDQGNFGLRCMDNTFIDHEYSIVDTEYFSAGMLLKGNRWDNPSLLS